MGSGTWTTCAYNASMASRGIANSSTISSSNLNQFYTQNKLEESLNPYKVSYRECCDSEEHPNTIPVILALDVTGSMGSACAAVARQLDKIMTKLYENVTDVEFMVMGIGDFAYDHAPLQVSQFESDERICDHLSKIWFEGHGGGNSFESYTAAWYFGLNHIKLDCWNRGKKGIIITMGDEPLNPYLPANKMEKVFGYKVQGDIDTVELYKEVTEKFDVYHIIITDPESSGNHYLERDKKTWGEVLDGQHLFVGNSNKLPEIINSIVTNSINDESNYVMSHSNTDGFGW